MYKNYSSPADDEDLSGCLLSGALQPKKVPVSNRSRYVPIMRDEISGVLRSNDDEDLSGCLLSGALLPGKHLANSSHQYRYITEEPDDLSGDLEDDDGDLSGCLLSMPLQPKKTAKNPIPLPQVTSGVDEMSGDLNSTGLGSDWLYLN
jgi:hypothetical protein